MWVGYTLLKTAAYVLVATSSSAGVLIALINYTPMDQVFARWLSMALTRRTGLELRFREIDTAWSWRTRSSVIVLRDLEVTRTYESCERLGVSPNQTYLKLRIARAQVELSAMWALAGRGLIRSLLVEHVRGLVDAAHLVWPSQSPLTLTDEARLGVAPAAPPHTTEYELFSVADAQVTVLQAGSAPLALRMDTLVMKPYRWQWQFLDLMCAREVDAVLDESNDRAKGTFVIRRESETANRAIIASSRGRVAPALADNDGSSSSSLARAREMAGSGAEPDASTRARAAGSLLPGTVDDGYNAVMAELLATPTQPVRQTIYFRDVDIRRIRESARGPLSWLTSGTVDLTFECRVPQTLLRARSGERRATGLSARVTVVLKNIYASIPLYDPAATFQETMYAQLARPLVAFLNAHPSRVELSFDVYLPVGSLDGAMGPWAAGLLDALSVGVFDELSAAVSQGVGQSISRSWTLWASELLGGMVELFWNANSVSLSLD